MLLCVDILLFHSKCIKLSLCFGIRNAVALPISEFSTKEKIFKSVVSTDSTQVDNSP